MKYCLGINTGFAVNRYSEHEEWIRIVGEDLGLRYAQLTADMLNADLPAPVLSRHTAEISRNCQKYGVNISSTFTGGFTRVNHMAHPDPEIRRHWINWFKRFVDISVDVGAESMGSHFGIFTHKDNRDPARREERRTQNIEGWHEIAEYAKKKGLKYLTWEPMSISREQGETLQETRRLQDDVSKDSPLPILICLDVDHGDVMSKNPDDTNPYSWLAAFGGESPLIHLKQSLKDKGGHWPFLEQYNQQGKIQPGRVLEALQESQKNSKFDHTYLLLELSFREREPTDSTVVEVLKKSVEFWRGSINVA